MELKHRAIIEACQPIASQAVSTGKYLPKFIPHFYTNNNRHTTNTNQQRRSCQDHSAGCRTANLPRSRKAENCAASTKWAFASSRQPTPFSGAFQGFQCTTHQGVRVCVCVCACVAGHHHATLCRVDLHGVVTLRVLREPRAIEGSAPPEHWLCNGRSPGLPA